MRAFVQIHTDGDFYNENYFNAWRAFEWFGYQTVKFKQFQVPDDITKETPVFASVQQTKMIFNKLNVQHSEIESYPHCLNKWFYRNIEIKNIDYVRQQVCQGKPIFAKPLDDDRKKFNGEVFKKELDLAILSGLDNEFPCYVSDLVDFKSEYRVFILDNEILDVRKYRGDFELVPSRNVINHMIKFLEFNSSFPKPVAYCLDVGVCISDKGHDYTSLVEVTDAWAFGGYGLNMLDYGKMIISRWEEMVKF